MSKLAFTVAQVNRYLKNLLENDALLAEVCVEGEISNYKVHPSGHLYFTLKDAQSTLNCVMFKGNVETGLPFTPVNGLKVVVCGYVSVYEKTGQYQLYAERMAPLGAGSLHVAFEQLCSRLRQEGLFDPARKKDLPLYAHCVALITSPTGAAIRDMLTLIRRRNPLIQVVVLPVAVQGQYAAREIVRALSMVNEWGGADVIILGRGGGSIEDLWAFNEESVARAVAASKIPVISAVGHEIDFTVTDFTADYRAPTPTAGAAAAVFDLTQLRNNIKMFFARMTDVALRIHYAKIKAFQALLKTRCLCKPLDSIYQQQLYVQSLERRLGQRISEIVRLERIHLQNKEALVERVSPYRIWSRGLAQVLDASRSEKVINTIRALEIDAPVSLLFCDGQAEARITEIKVRDGYHDGTEF